MTLKQFVGILYAGTRLAAVFSRSSSTSFCHQLERTSQRLSDLQLLALQPYCTFPTTRSTILLGHNSRIIRCVLRAARNHFRIHNGSLLYGAFFLQHAGRVRNGFEKFWHTSPAARSSCFIRPNVSRPLTPVPFRRVEYRRLLPQVSHSV